MAYDVKIREVRSWEFIVLLRIEESESNTSAATTWITNPRTIRLCPPNPALFIGRLLIAKLSTKLFQRKNLIQFSHAFSFPNKEFLLLPFMNYLYTLSLLFFAEMFISCSGVAVNSIRLNGNGCLSVRMLMCPPFRPRPPARVP